MRYIKDYLKSLTIILLAALFPSFAFAAKDFNIKNNTQNYFHVDGATGNIGIGTTTPQGRLVVTNGNVGIGTWAPTNPLSIVSSAGNIQFIPDTIGAGSKMQINATGSGAFEFGSFVGGAFNDLTNNTSFAAALSTNNLAFTLASSSAYIDFTTNNWLSKMRILGDGNVGIGTKTPQARLAVMGGNVGIGTLTAATASLETTGLRLIGNGAAAGNVLVSSSTGIGTWMAAGTLPAAAGPWSSGTGTVYTATGSDNIGIGTTTPQGGLVVTNGNVGIGTWAPVSLFDVNRKFNVLTSGLIGIGTTVPAYTLDLGVASYAVGVNIGNGGQVSPLKFYSSSGPSSRFITSAGAGARYLDIRVNGNESGWVDEAGYPEWASRIDVQNDAYSLIRGPTTAGNPSSYKTLFMINGNGNVGVGTTTPVGGLVVMNGNVGIGTWKPVAKVDIAEGNLSITNTAGSWDGRLTLGANASRGFIWSTNGAQSSNNGLDILAASTYFQNMWSGQYDVAIVGIPASRGSNVGIGTTTPQGAFMVTSGNVGIGTWTADNASLETTGLRLIGNGAAAGSVLVSSSTGIGTWMAAGTLPAASGPWTSGTGTVYTTTGTDNVGIGTSTSQGGLVVTNGNVGIGTWAPNKTLQVGINSLVVDTTTGYVGIGNASPTAPLTFAQIGGLDKIYLYDGGVGGDRYGFGIDSGEMIIFSGNNTTFSKKSGGVTTQLMRIDGMGNLGIGTMTPQSKLSVIGGNVGIGTWTADNASLETTGLRLIGNGAAAGSVLVSGSTGIGTWMAASTLATSGAASGWSTGTGTVYNTTGSDNIGIGTTTPQGGLVVTNGNVGIGTWAPNGAFVVAPIGNVGIGSIFPAAYFAVNAPPSSNSTSIQMKGGTPTANNTNGGSLSFTGGTSTGTGVGGSVTLTAGGSVANSQASGGSITLNGQNGTTGFGGGVAITTGNSGSGSNNGATIDMTTGGSSGGSINLKGGTTGGAEPRPTITIAGEYSGGNFINIVPGSVYGASGLPGGYLNLSGGPGDNANYSGGNVYITGGAKNGSGQDGDVILGVNSSGSYRSNIGIGTVTPQAKFSVIGGNVGIGTWTADNASLETTGLRLIGNGAAAGSVLVSSSTGIGTWMAASTLATSGAASGWSTGTGTVYNTTGSDNVGIGTTTPQGGLVVTNGNVGIGTWAPQAAFQVNSVGNGLGFVVDNQGNIGIGTVNTQSAAITILNGRVGIGTWKPDVAMQFGKYNQIVSGSPDQLWFASYSNTAGYPQMVGNWMSSGAWGIGPASAINTDFTLRIGGTSTPVSAPFTWSNTYPTNLMLTGNIGINTFAMSKESALYIASGNLAIGTTSPQAVLSIVGNVGVGTVKNGDRFLTTSPPAGGMIIEGNVGIGTHTPQDKLIVVGGNVGIGTWTAANTSLETTGLRLIGNGAAAGSVLVSSSTGIGTWMAASTLATSGAASGWSTGTGIVYNTTGSDKVGVGTTTPEGGLVVMNGNVGIGTWAPIATLEVKSSTIAITGEQSTGGVNIGSGSNGISLGYSNTNGWQSMVFGYSNNTNASSGAIAIGSSNTINNDNGVAIGIGNSVPAASNGHYGFVFGRGIVNRVFGVMIGVSDAAKITIDESGNLGVGTFTPFNKLSTVGGVGIGTGINSSFVTSAAPSGGMIVQGNVGLGTTTPQAQLAVLGGNVGIGTWTAANASLETTGLRLIGNGAAAGSVLVSSSTGIGTWMAASTLATSGAASGWSTGTGTVYNTTGSDNIGIGTITPQGGLVVTNGNVGIGTWAPDNALSVRLGNVGIGTGTTHSKLEVVGDGAQELLRINDSGPNDSSPLLITSGGNVGVGTSAVPYTMALFKNTTTANAVGGEPVAAAFWTTSTGTSPSARTVEIQNDAANGTAISMITSRSTVGDSQGISFVFAGALGQNYSPLTTLRTTYTAANSTNLVFSTASSGSLTDKVVFDANGNVGVGTVVPKNKMAIVGNVGVGTGINSPYLTTAAPSGGMIVQGNVGIGSYAPGTTLDVNGTQRIIASGGDGTGLNILNPSSMISIQLGATGSNTWYMGASTASNSVGAGKLYFSRSNSTSNSDVVIDGSGNLGVGTITPQARLSVTGGNVGIGTWTADSASLETTGLRLIGNNASAGSVLVSSSTGIGTWMAASTLATGAAASGWSTGTGTVYNTTGSDNVGIGTITPQGGLVVTNGNVGIGTWAPAGVFQVGSPTSAPFIVDANGGVGIGTVLTSNAGLTVMNGFVGIGTWKPGVALQVGRANRSVSGAPDQLYFGTYGGPGSGGFPQMIGNWVSTAAWGIGPATSNSDSTLQIGATTGSVPPTFAWSTANKTNFLLTGNIGINTFTMSSESALYVGGGNVALGTSSPQAVLSIVGNVGVGTVKNGDRFLTTSPPAGGMIIEGNVGIGTHTPQDKFIVVGGNVGIGTWTAANASLETTGLRLIGNNAAAGSVLVSSSTGIGTWMAASTLATGGAASGWSTGTGTVYNTTGSDKVGIGTTTPQGGFVVTNGNVGIGTWAPQALLDVYGTSDTYFTTNVGIGSVNPAQSLDVVGTGKFTTGINAPKITNLTSNGFVKTGSGDGTLSVDTSTYPSYTSMTTNYLQKAASSTTVGNSSIFDNGNVGIGTTTPQDALVVSKGNLGVGTWTAAAGVDTNTLRVRSNPGSGYVLVSGSTGIGTWMAASTLSTSGGGTPGGSSSQLQYNNGGSFDGIVNSNVTASGNVGLGTTLSKNKLDVQGGVGVGTLYAGYYTTPGNGMIIQGNVGVGSYAPEFPMVVVGDTTNAALGPLYVKANGLSTTVGAGVSLNAAASSGKTYSFISTGSSAAPGAGAFAVFNSTDSRYDWVQLSTGHLNFARNFYTDIAQVALIPTASNVVGLISRGAAAQTADLIQAQDSSGNVLVNVTAAGNVGIGTTIPQGRLVVMGENVGIGTWLTNEVPFSVVGETVFGSSPSILSAFGSMPSYFTIKPTTTAKSAVSIVAASGSTQNVLSIWTASGSFLGSVDYLGRAMFNTLYGTYNAAGNLTLDSTSDASKGNILINPIGGNVGIGTVTASSRLSVSGGVGIGTGKNSAYVISAAPTGGMMVEGNVGIGTTTPQDKFILYGGNVGIGTWTAQSSLQLKGSMGVAVVSKTANYTATVNDYVILVDASGGAVTITLPAASTVSGRLYNIKKTDSSANAVILDGNAAETVDGSATISTTTQYQSFTVVCDGTQWWVI